MEKEKQNMISRFLQGWGQLFSGIKNTPQPKPFLETASSTQRN